MMRPPYVKSLGDYKGMNVFAVNGPYVRKNMEPDGIDFLDFGEHEKLKFIPENEIWIDSGLDPAEIPFSVNHAWHEYVRMKSGHTYEDAQSDDDRDERDLRDRVGRLEGADLGKQLLADLGTLKVFSVSGKAVRNHDPDFILAGHGRLYRYIPNNEIWLDRDAMEGDAAQEAPYDLLHEMREWRLMGRGMSYLHAHKLSSCIELKARRNPDQIGDLLKREISLVRGAKGTAADNCETTTEDTIRN